MAKLVTVFGATGNQGGSVVRALIRERDTFKVRGVTRNIESNKGKELVQLGVEMVQASYDDASSIERAITGSYGVFFVTNSLEVDQATEERQGRNLVDTAKKVGVQHIIYSGDVNAMKLIGKSIPLLDGKANVAEYMFRSGILATSVKYANYYENILSIMGAEKTGDGEYVWNLPMEGKPMHMLEIEGSGRAIMAIFKDPKKFAGKVVGLSGDFKTVPEYCEIVNKCIAPTKLKAGTMTAAEYGKLGSPGAEDIGLMFDMLQSGLMGFDVNETKSLDPKTKDFESFVRDNKDKINSVFQ